MVRLFDAVVTILIKLGGFVSHGEYRQVRGMNVGYFARLH
jgi:hypothetical protein